MSGKNNNQKKKTLPKKKGGENPPSPENSEDETSSETIIDFSEFYFPKNIWIHDNEYSTRDIPTEVKNLIESDYIDVIKNFKIITRCLTCLYPKEMVRSEAWERVHSDLKIIKDFMSKQKNIVFTVACIEMHCDSKNKKKKSKKETQDDAPEEIESKQVRKDIENGKKRILKYLPHIHMYCAYEFSLTVGSAPNSDKIIPFVLKNTSFTDVRFDDGTHLKFKPRDDDNHNQKNTILYVLKNSRHKEPLERIKKVLSSEDVKTRAWVNDDSMKTYCNVFLFNYSRKKKIYTFFESLIKTGYVSMYIGPDGKKTTSLDELVPQKKLKTTKKTEEEDSTDDESKTNIIHNGKVPKENKEKSSEIDWIIDEIIKYTRQNNYVIMNDRRLYNLVEGKNRTYDRSFPQKTCLKEDLSELYELVSQTIDKDYLWTLMEKEDKVLKKISKETFKGIKVGKVNRYIVECDDCYWYLPTADIITDVPKDICCILSLKNANLKLFENALRYDEDESFRHKIMPDQWLKIITKEGYTVDQLVGLFNRYYSGYLPLEHKGKVMMTVGHSNTGKSTFDKPRESLFPDYTKVTIENGERFALQSMNNPLAFYAPFNDVDQKTLSRIDPKTVFEGKGASVTVTSRYTGSKPVNPELNFYVSVNLPTWSLPVSWINPRYREEIKKEFSKIKKNEEKRLMKERGFDEDDEIVIDKDALMIEAEKIVLERSNTKDILQDYLTTRIEIFKFVKQITGKTDGKVINSIALKESAKILAFTSIFYKRMTLQQKFGAVPRLFEDYSVFESEVLENVELESPDIEEIDEELRKISEEETLNFAKLLQPLLEERINSLSNTPVKKTKTTTKKAKAKTKAKDDTDESSSSSDDN